MPLLSSLDNLLSDACISFRKSVDNFRDSTKKKKKKKKKNMLILSQGYSTPLKAFS